MHPWVPGSTLTVICALDDGALDAAIIANADLTVPFADEDTSGPIAEQRRGAEAYANFLLAHAHNDIKYASWANGGAEANEKAFDLCRMNGPGGKRILAFEGSFHGRTMMSLQATWNKIKRAPFQFDGYTCDFVAFPDFKTPHQEPDVPMSWIETWSKGEIPQKTDDELRNREIESLTKLKGQIEAGDVCCVIVEPMQSEGGDNYGTARFYNGLRALTRHHETPLIFDEVQVGFRLGGPFYWHDLFNLKNAAGEADAPDCVTLAKKPSWVLFCRVGKIRVPMHHVLQKHSAV